MSTISPRGFALPDSNELDLVLQLLKLCQENRVAFPFNQTSALRFLRDKKGNVAAAFKNMQRHSLWRIENNVEGITEDSIQKEMKKKVMMQTGFDRNHRPTLYGFVRNYKKEHRDLEATKRLLIWSLEKALLQSHPEEQRLVVIADLSQFSMKNIDYDMIKMAINVLQANYPETMHVALVVNAPFIFNACYSIIRPWLDPVTAAKVHFISGDRLLEFVEEDQIPVEFIGFRRNVAKEKSIKTVF